MPPGGEGGWQHAWQSWLISPAVTLDEWVSKKRDELSRQPRIEPRNLTPSIRDFTHAIATQRRQIAVIAEIARSTPEEGSLREDLDVSALAQTLDACGISALAIATDNVVCRGSFGDVIGASAAVSSPIICRDLVIERNQLFCARFAQADAVLLTLGVVSPNELRVFLELATSMHMAAPVEVHSAQELDAALSLGSRLIVVSAFRGASLDLPGALPLLSKVPHNVISIVRGPFSRPGELAALYGQADAIWTAGPISSSPSVENWLKKFVDAAESGES